MKPTLWILVAVLIALHQDNWLWTNDHLLFGFMPTGLFYHACISVAASALWWWATKYSWPLDTTNTIREENAA